MAAKATVSINCPYCGFSNLYVFELEQSWIPGQLVHCNVEDGGCDKEFVLYPKLEVTATAWKIEGVEDDS